VKCDKIPYMKINFTIQLEIFNLSYSYSPLGKINQKTFLWHIVK